ncbi:hypothetical protein [Microvirga brassicacearum]|uniref:Uncharacterized protein n=1 Tax=Microvirga brassicacearum TaxID=2580413 RepID=A0A5N3P6L2_9HYPH|nr:hypothetical protein [Microvirga brassicacearum]KAB0265352.1 hypothetical protein FEZ63_18675 [Microvirga brassicacearum]
MLTERKTRHPDGITEERLERALEVLSALVAEHGEKHVPLRAMIEGQLCELRARKLTRDRMPAYAEAG